MAFELEDRREIVRLVLTHSQLPIEIVPRCGAGWHTHLDILLAQLRGEAREPFLPVYQRLLQPYLQHSGSQAGTDT